jgi:hypothetical protein
MLIDSSSVIRSAGSAGAPPDHSTRSGTGSGIQSPT